MENNQIQKSENAITIDTIMQQSSGTMITSFKADPNNREMSIKIFNALNNPTDKVSAHINEVIEVQDFLIEMVAIEDKLPDGSFLGTYSIVPRCVLVASDGMSYQAVSKGIANAIRKATIACGNAPWVPPLKFKILQIPVKMGSMLTVEMVL